MTYTEQYGLLLYKYLQGTITEEETILLNTWLGESPEHKKLFEELTHEDLLPEAIREYHPANRLALETRILNAVKSRVPMKPAVVPFARRPFFRIAAAACIILLFSIGGYLLLHKESTREQTQLTKTNDVEAPKTSKAMITLADGSIVSIDSLTKLRQGNVEVTKTAGGEIKYSGNASEMVYNTLTNPRGSTVIDMQLADGSHVWLNAGSSVRYPIAFAGDEREVSVSGEAYFEVTPDKTKPFKVVKGAMSVEVLGTHFNVNAYDEEPDIRVTLLEGSVKVNKGNNMGLLKPGQQAQVTADVKVLGPVDTEQVMAWKNGVFNFEGAGVQEVMRQLERWYDIRVVYEKGVPQVTFGGKMTRDVNLSGVMRILEDVGVHFRMEEGRVLVILP